jgi:hypothetical protein
MRVRIQSNQSGTAEDLEFKFKEMGLKSVSLFDWDFEVIDEPLFMLSIIKHNIQYEVLNDELKRISEKKLNSLVITPINNYGHRQSNL